MNEKRICLMICLGLIMLLVPNISWADSTSAETVYVGNAKVTEDTYWKSDGDGGLETATGPDDPECTVKYVDGTLTLKDATITKYYPDPIQPGIQYGIYSAKQKEDLTIHLEGSNVIDRSAWDGSGQRRGVYVSGNLIVTGTGSLLSKTNNTHSGASFHVNSLTITDASVSGLGGGSGVTAAKSITINNGSLSGEGELAGVNTSDGDITMINSDLYGYSPFTTYKGVQVNGNISMDSTSRLIAEGDSRGIQSNGTLFIASPTKIWQGDNESAAFAAGEQSITSLAEVINKYVVIGPSRALTVKNGTSTYSTMLAGITTTITATPPSGKLFTG